MVMHATTQPYIIYRMVAKYDPAPFQDLIRKISEANNNLGTRGLADLFGFSHPVMVEINKGLQPTEKTCVMIALASGYPVEYVLQLGGYIRPTGNKSISKARLDLYSEIEKTDTTDDVLKETADYVRFRKKSDRGKKDGPDKRDTRPRDKRDS
jgi:hypothetical protein